MLAFSLELRGGFERRFGLADWGIAEIVVLRLYLVIRCSSSWWLRDGAREVAAVAILPQISLSLSLSHRC